MQIPDHLIKHGFEYLVIGILGLAGLGALGYMDNRHVLQTEAKAQARAAKIIKYDEMIEQLDNDTDRLEIYNQSGSQTNAPARSLIIKQNEKKRERLVSKKEAFISER